MTSTTTPNFDGLGPLWLYYEFPKYIFCTPQIHPELTNEDPVNCHGFAIYSGVYLEIENDVILGLFSENILEYHPIKNPNMMSFWGCFPIIQL